MKCFFVCKHKFLLVFVAAVLCMLAHVRNAAAQTTDDAFAATLTVSSKAIIVHEPLKMTFSWKNVSAEDQELFVQSEEKYVYLAYGNEKEFTKYRLFFPMEEELIEGISPRTILTTLKPGEAYTRTMWVALGQSGEASAWQFLFDKAGTYRVCLYPDGKQAVTIQVKDVTDKTDTAAFKLFSSKAAEIFLEETLDTRSAERDLKKIQSRYAKSRYAGYAALALATNLWETNPGFDLNYRTFKKYLDFIIAQHAKNRLLAEEALWLLIKGTAFQEGGKETAVAYLMRLQKEFPESPYISRAEEEFGIELNPLLEQ